MPRGYLCMVWFRRTCCESPSLVTLPRNSEETAKPSPTGRESLTTARTGRVNSGGTDPQRRFPASPPGQKLSKPFIIQIRSLKTRRSRRNCLLCTFVYRSAINQCITDKNYRIRQYFGRLAGENGRFTLLDLRKNVILRL